MSNSSVHSGRPADARYDAMVVGAGFAGLYALYRLRKLGFSARALEANADVGGVWYSNRYPGAHCDVESFDYAFSFSPELEQDWTWSKRFAPQSEILAYLQHVADRFDLRRDIEFETRVTKAAYSKSDRHWSVETNSGQRFEARFLVMASGSLSVPIIPAIEGLDSFSGQLLFTSSWPHENVELEGKRVGVLGTGSSGIQVIPELAKVAGHLSVFQRTPAFSIPAKNKLHSAEEIVEIKANYAERRQVAKSSFTGMTWQPHAQSAMDVSEVERTATYEEFWNSGANLIHSFPDLLTNRQSNNTAADFARSKVREILKDPELSQKMTSMTYPIGAKRVCRDTDYYETFLRDNVSLVDLKEAPIERITERGVKTKDGEHELDVLVLATGFDALTGAVLAMDVSGQDNVPLRQRWADGPTTYLGIMTAQFPNLFLITGPGSPSVLSNMVMSIEQHVEWATDLMVWMRDRNYGVVVPLAQAETDWVAHLNEIADRTLYPLAQSWYVGANKSGKPRVFMPYVGGVGNYRAKCDAEAEGGYPNFEFAGA
uniref:NAD(P)/FAD-dependent oxidoreductase n=1 Tax=Bosea sp. NBC_00436 TaxID=2969620 RepID=A0A9E7ZRT3_9HYPH